MIVNVPLSNWNTMDISTNFSFTNPVLLPVDMYIHAKVDFKRSHLLPTAEIKMRPRTPKIHSAEQGITGKA